MWQRDNQFQVNNIKKTKKESLHGESERKKVRFFAKTKRGTLSLAARSPPSCTTMAGSSARTSSPFLIWAKGCFQKYSFIWKETKWKPCKNHFFCPEHVKMSKGADRLRRCRIVGRTGKWDQTWIKDKSIKTFLEATNPLPLPLPFNSATTIGWQLDLCRLQSFFWQACVDT